MTEGQGGTTPAGWYPDPEGNGERWWNGMTWGELRAPAQGSAPGYPPQTYVPQQTLQPQHAAGMRCHNCQFTEFSQAEFQLNPFNTSATCLICRRCGFIHWFATR